MAQFHVLGDELVSKGLLIEKAAAIESLTDGGQVDLPSGRSLSLQDIEDAIPPPPDQSFGIGDEVTEKLVTEFTPIGPNKPLTILLQHVYTGRYPRSGGFFGGGGKDLAVVSGLKDYSVFAAASRAVNILKQGAKANSSVSGSAFDQGTPLISYQAAVVSDSQTITVEGAFDNFPDEFVSKVGDAFAAAAGIPLFLPYAGYLMTASVVTKLVGGWADALFDGRPAFSFNETLDFNVPGRELPTADFRLLCSNQFDASGMRFDPKLGLIDKATNKPYAGDEPYVVISLDGAERPKLVDFAPTVASAAVLQRFFNLRDRGEASINAVIGGLKLLSDSKYREDADKLKKVMDALPAGDEKKAAEARYKALLKNIVDEKMKPPA